MVGEFGRVERALTARHSELSSLERELQTKAKALEKLKTEYAKVPASIAALRDSGVKEINSIRNSAVAEVKRLCWSLHQDIDKWGDMRAEMGKCQEELKLARYFVTSPLSEQALSSLVGEIGIQVVVQYLMTGLAWCQTNFDPKLRPPKAITKRYYSISEYTQVELADILNWALLMLIGGGESGSDKR